MSDDVRREAAECECGHAKSEHVNGRRCEWESVNVEARSVHACACQRFTERARISSDAAFLAALESHEMVVTELGAKRLGRIGRRLVALERENAELRNRTP